MSTLKGRRESRAQPSTLGCVHCLCSFIPSKMNAPIFWMLSCCGAKFHSKLPVSACGCDQVCITEFPPKLWCVFFSSLKTKNKTNKQKKKTSKRSVFQFQRVIMCHWTLQGSYQHFKYCQLKMQKPKLRVHAMEL